MLMLTIISIKPTPFKTNIDYYRGKTKSIYEKEPMFRDFARNIPLSQVNLKDSNFDIFPTRDPELGRPDPLKPSAVSGDIKTQRIIIVNLK